MIEAITSHLAPRADLAGKTATSPTSEFEETLKSLGLDFTSALRTSEATSAAAITGNGSMQQAVIATMQAEQSLQAALAIRDKVVSAFLEISRMQI
jgi:flagellar hook-basal body complex protein FliE